MTHETPREEWPWYPGVVEGCTDGEYQVTVYARELAELEDGSPAPDGTADDDLWFPGCFRDETELRPVEVEVVADERLEEPACPAGRVEDDGAPDLDLPHRALPPVPGIPVGGTERHREAVQPPLDEDFDGARLEAVADLLEPCGIVAGGEAVGQLGEADAALSAWRLAHSCPLTQILAG